MTQQVRGKKTHKKGGEKNLTAKLNCRKDVTQKPENQWAEPKKTPEQKRRGGGGTVEGKDGGGEVDIFDITKTPPTLK